MTVYSNTFVVEPDDSTSPSNSNVTALSAKEDKVVINNLVYDFVVESIERRALVKAINAALASSWFSSLSKQSRISYLSALKPFLEFIQRLTKDDFSTALFSDFVEYRVNVVKVKKQSTNLNPVALCVSEGLKVEHFSAEQMTYLRATIAKKPKIAKAKRKQVAFSDYFFNLAWFREHLTDSEVYELSNQQSLMGSFTTSVAVLLIQIMQAKHELLDIQTRNPTEDFEELLPRSQRIKYIEAVIDYCGELQPESQLKLLKLLQIDVINKTKHVSLDGDADTAFSRQQSTLSQRGSYHYADITAYENLTKPSNFEQLLLSFLLAAQAVQPSNLKTLSVGNIVLVKNSRGEIVQVYLKYFKTRASQAKETPYLSFKDSIVAQAIVGYTEYFNDKGSCLFDSNFNPDAQIHFTPSAKNRTLVSRFFSALRIYEPEVLIELRRNGNTQIFPKICQILEVHGDMAMPEWWTSVANREGSKSYDRYKSDIDNYLPQSFFSLGAIKTSAVFAGATQFDRNATKNFNSHSNATELNHYLTDDNQDWQDRNGQVTRLVTNDLQNYAFRPSDHPAIDSVSVLVDRTLIVGDTEHRSPNIRGYATSSSEEKSEGIERVVIDSAETVVLLKHYIEQAQTFSKELAAANKQFFEWEVLPNSEWAEIVLAQKLSPMTVRKGVELYRALKHKLPALFNQKIEGKSH